MGVRVRNGTLTLAGDRETRTTPAAQASACSAEARAEGDCWVVIRAVR